jgi:hypothetical protein
MECSPAARSSGVDTGCECQARQGCTHSFK